MSCLRIHAIRDECSARDHKSALPVAVARCRAVTDGKRFYHALADLLTRKEADITQVCTVMHQRLHTAVRDLVTPVESHVLQLCVPCLHPPMWTNRNCVQYRASASNPSSVINGHQLRSTPHSSTHRCANA